MENNRRSLRIKKKPKKFRDSFSDDLSEDSIIHDETDEITSKLSKLQTSSTPSRAKSKRLNKTVQEKAQSSEILRKTPSKQVRKKNTKDVSSESYDEDSDNEPVEKPSEVLFEEDISGKIMFGFKRNKRKGGLAQRVSEAVNSPLRPFNLNKSIQNSPSTTGTPKISARNAMKEKMKEKFAELEMDSSFEAFSDSGSEYKGSNSESSESEFNSEVEEKSSDNESDEELKIKTPKLPKNKPKDLSTTLTRNRNQNYVMKSDDYFSWQASSKIVTSNHTLQKLKNPKLSEDQLQELLSSCNVNQSEEHEYAIRDMFKYNCSSFSKWMFLLNEGFNILLYGLGSKRNILKAFHQEKLGSSPVLVVNGYFPSLTIKDITDSILLDIFQAKSSPTNVYEAVELIEKRCDRQKNVHLYLLVHNIDGPMLRNNKSQNILASLANISNVHLLTSIDHINTPLIWDHNKLSKFNFIWWDVTSFLPYSDETSFESSMLVQRSGALALASLGSVYQSLTKNSKGIFMLIVKHQLNNKSVKYYQGMPFKVLYSQCREHFLVSSDLALRTQLTEFLDHKLVKSKRTTDGVEQLIIPINNSLLQQFVEQHS